MFLSHASVGLPIARELYTTLVQFGIDVWMDDFRLLNSKEQVIPRPPRYWR